MQISVPENTKGETPDNHSRRDREQTRPSDTHRCQPLSPARIASIAILKGDCSDKSAYGYTTESAA